MHPQTTESSMQLCKPLIQVHLYACRTDIFRPGGCSSNWNISNPTISFFFFFCVWLIGVLIRPVGVYFYLVHFLVAITTLLGGGVISLLTNLLFKDTSLVYPHSLVKPSSFFWSSAIDLIQPPSYLQPPHTNDPVLQAPPHL